MSGIHDLPPVYLTADGPHITDSDRARAMRITMDTGRPVHITVRPRRWWQFWKPRNTNA